MTKVPKYLRDLARLQEKHNRTGKLCKRNWSTPFPDLKIEHDASVAPCTNSFGNGRTKKKELPSDAKQFPVGHQHKQGLELITPGTDLKWMGGRKS